MFIEKGNSLFNLEGYFSFIVPNAFLANENSKGLRGFILKNYSIANIVDCGKEIFADADVESLVFVMRRKKYSIESTYSIFKNGSFIFKNLFNTNDFESNKNKNFIVTLDNTGKKIFSNIKRLSKSIEDYYRVSTGIKEYQVGKGDPPQTQNDKDNLVFNATFKKNESVNHSHWLERVNGENWSSFLMKIE